MLQKLTEFFCRSLGIQCLHSRSAPWVPSSLLVKMSSSASERPAFVYDSRDSGKPSVLLFAIVTHLTTRRRIGRWGFCLSRKGWRGPPGRRVAIPIATKNAPWPRGQFSILQGTKGGKCCCLNYTIDYIGKPNVVDVPLLFASPWASGRNLRDGKICTYETGGVLNLPIKDTIPEGQWRSQLP